MSGVQLRWTPDGSGPGQLEFMAPSRVLRLLRGARCGSMHIVRLELNGRNPLGNIETTCLCVVGSIGLQMLVNKLGDEKQALCRHVSSCFASFDVDVAWSEASS